MAGSKSVFSSPLEKIHTMGANPESGLECPGGQGFKGLDILRVGKLMGQGNGSTTLPSMSWGDVITTPGSRLGSSARETALAETASSNCEFALLSTRSFLQEIWLCYCIFYPVGLLPYTFAARIMAARVHGHSADTLGFICEGDEPLGSMEEVEAQTIGDLLPTDDDLISGVVDGFDFAGLSINQDDADEDIFGTGGGMELESDDYINNGAKNLGRSLKSQISGEHYINKCPSRTLFIRNVSANIVDSELRALFQVFNHFPYILKVCLFY
jgi:hypothetical protein